MKVEIVPVAQVDNIWPLLAPGFVACLDKTPTNIGCGDFWTMCRSGNAYLIICHDESGIQSASVWQFDGDLFRCLLMYGGPSGLWCHALFEFAADTARMNGATSLWATGRRGLGRMLARNGVPATEGQSTKIDNMLGRKTWLVEVSNAR